MGAARHLDSLGGRDIGIDLGTSNTVIYVRGRGVVLSEPSVVATAESASLTAVKPLKDGAMAGIEGAASMLRRFIREVHQSRFEHPRIALCVPARLTHADKRALVEVCLSEGAGSTRLIEGPLAAAIGAGLAVREPRATMIADLGAGSTEVAVISSGRVAVASSIAVGGDALDEAIAERCARVHGLRIEPETAEEVKLEIGSATPLQGASKVEVRGSDLGSKVSRTVLVGSEEVRGALGEPLGEIVAAVSDTLERTPPRLSGAIMGSGITLAGGGSLLQGLKQHLRDECQMPCQLAESPLTCVAVGSGISLEDLEAIQHTRENPGFRRRHA